MSNQVTCDNCREVLSLQDNFCPNCGQEQREKQIRLKDYLLDFLGDFFTFDSKFFKSIYPLLFKPGKMTREYMDGKRVRYIPPLRFFLFTSVVFFFVLSNVPQLQDYDFTRNIKFNDDMDRADSLAADTLLSFQEQVLQKPASMSDKDVAQSLYPEIEGIAKLALIQAVKLIRDQGSKFTAFLISNGTVVLIALLLIFSLFLKFFYLRKKIFFVTHMTFSLHFHSFLLLLSIVVAVVAKIFGKGNAPVYLFILGAALILALVYLLVAIKNFYRQKRSITLIKFVFISGLYFFLALPVSLIATFLIGFFLF